MASGDFRVLGRDITLRMTEDGALLKESTAIQKLTFKINIKLLEEGFLGEGAQRQREIFDSVGLAWSVEPEGKEIFLMIYDVYQRARQGTANPPKINMSFRIQFANGATVRISVPDIQFDDIGNLDVTGRDAFAMQTFSGKSNRYLLNT